MIISRQSIETLNIIGGERNPRNEASLYDIRRSIIKYGKSESKHPNNRSPMRDYVRSMIQSDEPIIVMFFCLYINEDLDFMRSIMETIGNNESVLIIVTHSTNIPKNNNEEIIHISEITDIPRRYNNHLIDCVVMLDAVTRIEDFPRVMTELHSICKNGARFVISDIDAYDYKVQIYEDIYYIIRHIEYYKSMNTYIKYKNMLDYYSNYHSFNDLSQTMRLLGFTSDNPNYIDNRSIYYATFTKTHDVTIAVDLFGVNTKYNLRNIEEDESLHTGLLKIFDNKDQSYLVLIATHLGHKDVSKVYNTLINTNPVSNSSFVNTKLANLIQN